MKHSRIELRCIAFTGICLLCVSQVAFATTPPNLLNYQGVLRGVANQPLNGTYLMTFRFIDVANGGTDILVDTHGDAAGGTVVVTDGLFNVQLGGGTVSDGAGPGVYTSLANVFRDYDNVMLRVEVEGEVLSPDVRVIAAAYAHNASFLSGLHDSQFLRADQNDTAVGNIYLAGSPSGSAISQGLLYVNPGSTDANDTLLGVAVGSQQRLRMDAEGDTDLDGTLAVVGSGTDYAVTGTGPIGGGYFADTNQSGWGRIGYGERGIEAFGFSAGGYFADTNGTGYAYTGSGNNGVQAYGSAAGGFFEGGYGVSATGVTAGGYFADSFSSGYAEVGTGDYGIRSFGNFTGGYFKDSNASGYILAGINDRGIDGFGNQAGGYFEDLNSSGYAYVGEGHYGIRGYGETAGAFFEDSDDGGQAYIGWGEIGVEADTSHPASFAVRGHNGGGLYGALANSTTSTSGNGTKAFVQNHPLDDQKVIRYVSLEGDEAGTYTRGSGRLVDGVAHVTLGETFQWVTNPDIGLTAHLTPRGENAGLHVESLSTTELVVRGNEGSSAAFDFIVHGLRIGFEETNVVTDKLVESLIPSMATEFALYEREPGMRAFNALERFRGMAAKVDGSDVVDLSRAEQLAAAVGRYDPEIHGPVSTLHGFDHPDIVDIPPRLSDEYAPAANTGGGVGEMPTRSIESSDNASFPRPPAANVPTVESPEAEAPPMTVLPVSETVEAGDVLAFDPESGGLLLVAASIADPAVVGVATGDSKTVAGDDARREVPVALTGLVNCKVDAGYGAIRAGDLLTSSPTAGHAMRALEALPGNILGKAAQPLETGTGTIKIIVTPR